MTTATVEIAVNVNGISKTFTASAETSGDPGKDAYRVGYELWMQKKYPEAIAALHAMIAKYPKHVRSVLARLDVSSVVVSRV